MTVIESKRNTFLKKSPEQSNLLPDAMKVSVATGNNYLIREVLDNQGLHDHLSLMTPERNFVGNWWIFKPHWEYLNKPPITAKFTLKQPPIGVREYVQGSLTFSDGFSITASSGAQGFQYKGAHKIVGKGLIPASDRWRINLPGYRLNTKGVEGHFWHITPDPFMGRGELGLHRDANVLGSSGCVVVPSKVFSKLENYLKEKAMEYEQIKLEVSYT